MRNKPLNPTTAKTLEGIAVTVKELIALRHHITHYTTQHNTKQLSLPGQRLTRSHGRSIEFAATREYQAGDDIRAMAWRVTARSMKPQIKIYHEEKERPVWLAVDLSPNLYFGTRCMFKSVASIRQASLLGWKYLHQHERVGAMIATKQKTLVYPPQSYEHNFLTILASLSQHSQRHPFFNDDNYLHDLLHTLQQRVRSGNLIYLLSDFVKFNDENQKLIAHIAKRAQVALIFIYDPFEAKAPPPYPYKVTNGEQTISFNTNNAEYCLHYQQQFHHAKNKVIHFAQQHPISLQILCTDPSQEECV